MSRKNPWKTDNGLQVSFCLGEGSFAKVWRASHKLDKANYAVKLVNLVTTVEQIEKRAEQIVEEELSDSEILEKLRREVDFHSKLNSSFIVKYHSHWFEGLSETQEESDVLSKLLKRLGIEDSKLSLSETSNFADSSNSISTSAKNIETMKEKLFIQMEFCNQGNLKTYLIRNPDFHTRKTETLRIINHLAKGLESIHALGIIHRDIKPDNIFCQKMPGGGNKIWKYGDFGLSIESGVMERIQQDNLPKDQDLTETDKSSSKTFAGGPGYMSPEMWSEESYTEKTDIFSLALVYLEVLNSMERTEKFEFFDNLRKENANISELVSQKVPEMFAWMKPILTEMLNPVFSERPSATWVFQKTLFPIRFGFPFPENCEKSEGENSGKNLTKLSKLIHEEKQCIVLFGPNGSGKTKLVQNLLQLEEFKEVNIFWIDLRGSDVFIRGLAAEVNVRAREEGIVEYFRPNVEILGDVCQTLKKEYSKFKSIFILDNVYVNEFEEIFNVLLASGFPFILINTVNRCYCYPPSDNIRIFSVDGFATSETEKYIENETEKLGLRLGKELIQEFARICGNLPFIVKQGVNFLKSQGSSDQDFNGITDCALSKGLGNPLAYFVLGQITDFIKKGKEVLNVIIPLAFCDEFCLGPYGFGLQDLRIYFTRNLNSSTASVDYFPELEKDFEEVVQILIENDLVQLSLDGLFISLSSRLLPPIFRGFVSSRIEAENEILSQTMNRLILLRNLFVNHSSEYYFFGIWDLLAKHPKLIKQHRSSIYVFSQAYRGRLEPETESYVVPQLEGLAQAFTQVLGDDNQWALNMRLLHLQSLFEVGIGVVYEAEFEVVLSLVTKLAEDCVKHHGLTHGTTLATHFLKCQILNGLRRFDESLKIFDHLLQRKDLLPKKTVHYVTCAYANTLYLQGNFGKGDKVYAQVFENCVEEFGPENDVTLDAQFKIAKRLFEEERYEESLQKLVAILPIHERIFGEDGFESGIIKYFIGLCLWGLGQKEKAKVVLSHIENLAEKRHGKNHWQTMLVKEFNQEENIHKQLYVVEPIHSGETE